MSSLVVCQPLTEKRIAAGETLYREGKLLSGATLEAVVQGDVTVSGAQFSCVACHGRSGMGSVEGARLAPPVIPPYLDAPRKLKSRPRPPYTEAALARERREPIPDLQLRGGMQQNGELLSPPSGRAVGLQGFADVGVRIPIFNRNQGNIATAKADAERAKREVDRVKLLLRERAASVVQNYTFSQTAVDRYKNQMIPRAQKAYKMYSKKYQEMAAAYPQVLIAQRTLMQLEVSYLNALESFATSSLSLQSYLLTDGLESPAQPGGMDKPVREVNVPLPMGTGPQ